MKRALSLLMAVTIILSASAIGFCEGIAAHDHRPGRETDVPKHTKHMQELSQPDGMRCE